MPSFANPAHVDHDALLIAGHAAGDLPDIQVPAASALLSSCSDCLDLHRDLVAISAVTRALPRSARTPRDFRLTAEQAASLRRGSRLRALLRPFASARSATRPMAAAFTSLGVAGLLVAAFMPGLAGLAGGAASAPGAMERDTYSGAGAPAPTAAPAAQPGSQNFGPQSGAGATANTGKADFATDDGGFHALNGEDAEQGDETGQTTGAGRMSMQTSPPNLLVMGSLGFLLVGLAIYGLRVAARRVR
jgi:hypothetical protein